MRLCLPKPLIMQKTNNKNVHFLGLLSNGGVHSHITHLKGLITAADEAGVPQSYVHAFTDGRDVDPKSGKGFLTDLVDFCASKKCDLATVIGRYFAMDRDKRWERVKKLMMLCLTEWALALMILGPLCKRVMMLV